MAIIVKPAGPESNTRAFTAIRMRPLCAAALAVMLASCSKLGMGQDEMNWARSALDRNETLQVVASDPQARTFTVRLKGSNQLVVIPIDGLVAGPAIANEPAVAAAVAPAPDVVSDSSAGAGSAAVSDQHNGQMAANGAKGAPAPAANESGEAASGGAPGPAPAAAAVSEPVHPGAGAQAHNAAGESSDTAGEAQGPHSESAVTAKAGSVLASGPGYSIKASGPKAGASRLSVSSSAARGTPVERLHDPIICQGSRLLHIDNRNLEFDGDAVNAEDGCELHITNSHIFAKGIGVLARAANVHIENSEIEGDSGAIDASEGAQVYAESSRFKGLTRRMEASAFHDLGGNVWN